MLRYYQLKISLMGFSALPMLGIESNGSVARKETQLNCALQLVKWVLTWQFGFLQDIFLGLEQTAHLVQMSGKLIAQVTRGLNISDISMHQWHQEQAEREDRQGKLFAES